MKQSVKFSISVWVAILLSNATGVAAPQLSGELGRGFPYLSGGEWTWGPWVFFFILIIILSIAGMVIDKLKDHPWWHTLIVVVATLLSSVAFTVKISQPYSAEIGLIVFMLIPCFAGIALLYLAIMRLVRSAASLCFCTPVKRVLRL